MKKAVGMFAANVSEVLSPLNQANKVGELIMMCFQ